MHSSLSYQVITYFNLYYLAFFGIFEAGIFAVKLTILPYPIPYLVCDLAIFLAAAALEYLRLQLGRKGNLTEKQLPIIASLILTIPADIGAVYVLLWQTYVLRIEIILATIHFFFHLVEILWLICLAVGFSKHSELA